MAKKYLSLEEAAAKLGLRIDELNRRRERGDIRGFADRGTWKFKQDDVEEFRRQLHPDSSPEVPLIDKGMEASVLGDSDSADEQPTVIRGGGSSKKNILQGTSDSDVRLVVDDSITGGDDSDPEVTLPPMGGSDSDVRLIDEDVNKVIDSGSDSDVQLVGADSDSDVKLAEGDSDSDVKVTEPDSDSDVKMIPSDSDSDVKLVQSDSDSDVQMVQADSDSDVKMTQSDSGIDVRMLEEPGGSTIVTGGGKRSDDAHLTAEIDATVLAHADSDVKLASPRKDQDATDKMKLPPGRASDSSVLADDSLIGGSSVKRAAEEESGISLDLPDSGKLAAAMGDSGISLDATDSGISLEEADSGISIEAGGSGIALEGVDDSGISLHEDDSGSYALADDSGIDVASASDSGIALDSKDVRAKGGDNMSGTVPMVEHPLDVEDTQAELKTPGKPAGGAQDGETSVILFQDEDEEQLDTRVRGRKGKGGGPRRRDSDDKVGTLDTADDAFDAQADSFAEAVDFDDNDLEVVEDVLGDSSGDFDQEIASLDEMDVFDAADEDFEDSFLAGESQQEFAAPAPAISGAMALGAPAEWGLSAFIPLLASTMAMLVCGMLMVDMVRTMWGWQDGLAPFGGPIIEFFAGLFSGK